MSSQAVLGMVGREVLIVLVFTFNLQDCACLGLGSLYCFSLELWVPTFEQDAHVYTIQTKGHGAWESRDMLIKM